MTPHQAKYFAFDLTKRAPPGASDQLSMSLFDASVDLNPHQIEAAMFALQSPLSEGVILADEVGLGKTIEAGIVLCQRWAERKRRLLIICPASLRKQWATELDEKFNLPAVVLDAEAYGQMQRGGSPRPFGQKAIVIVSYEFAARMQEAVHAEPWDLVVIDEAHKLRNAWQPNARVGQALKGALEGRRKILLTATPLQNSLMELYGLSTIIDEHLFGDPNAFRSRYVNAGGDLDGLRERLSTFCKRTLRRQVLEYVRYRNRNPGNIEHVPANKWQGLADPPSDGRFCRFTSHELGIRALAALLVTYQDRHKLRTPRAIIERWAPKVENDTASYIAVVARRIGVGADDTIDLHRHDHLRPLVEAIIHQECAGLSYPAAVIDRALTLAGVPPAAPVTLREVAAITGTGRSAVLVGAAGTATAVAQAAPAIQALGTLAPAVAIAVIAAAVLGVLAWRLRRPA